MKHILVIILFQVGWITSRSQNSFFSEEFLKSVVQLEKKTTNGNVPHGTGFALYDYKDPESVIIVTCEHVLRNNVGFPIIRPLELELSIV